MAFQRKGILDGFNGSVSIVTGRTMNGRSFISRKQKSRKEPLSQLQVLNINKCKAVWQNWNSANASVAYYMFRYYDKSIGRKQTIFRQWYKCVNSSGGLIFNNTNFMQGNVPAFINCAFVSKNSPTQFTWWKQPSPDSVYPAGTKARCRQLYCNTTRKWIGSMGTVTASVSNVLFNSNELVVGYSYTMVVWVTYVTLEMNSEIRSFTFIWP